MAIKITMLKERFIPVLNRIGKVNDVVKVNNEIGHYLVKNGDAEYLDSGLMDMLTEKWDGRETATMEPEENEMMPRAEMKKPGKKLGFKKGR